MASGALDVTTNRVRAIGDLLIKHSESIDSTLSSMNTKASSISSSWKDSAGTSYRSKFSSLVTKAGSLSTALGSLGNALKEMATDYETAESDCVSSMGG